MPTYQAPGVYMEEVDKGPKPIEAVATAVAGFVGLAARGPLNKAIPINSWSDYVRVFGGHAPDSLMSYAVFGYFNNGGQNAYAVRVANPKTMRRARHILSHQAPNRPTAPFEPAEVVAGTVLPTSLTGLAPGDTLTFAPSLKATIQSVDADSGVVAFTAAVSVPMPLTTPPTYTAATEPATGWEWELLTAAAPGDQTLSVVDATGLAVGDEIKLSNGTDEETVTVQAVNGATGVVTLSAPLAGGFTFAAGDTATLGTAAAKPAAVPLRLRPSRVVLADITGLPVGARLLVTESGATTGETVTVTGVKSDNTLTFAPGLQGSYTNLVLTVKEGTAFPSSYSLADSFSAATSIGLTDTSGLAVGDRIALWETEEEPETRTITEIAGTTVTLDSALTHDYTAAAVVAPHPALSLQAAPDPASLIGEDMDAQSNGMGTWGNHIQVRVDAASLGRAKLAAELELDAQEAKLSSTTGMEVGSLVKLRNRVTGAEAYRVITAVYKDQKRVAWADEVDNTLFPPDETEVATVEFRLTARHRWSGVTEVFDGLSMQGASSRYAMTFINTDAQERKASSLISVMTDLTASAGLGGSPQLLVPAAMKKGEWLSLRGGRNGSEGITVSEFRGHNLGPDDRVGLGCFEGVDQVTMVICADAVGSDDKGSKLFGGDAAQVNSLHQAVVEHCEGMLDRFAILDCREALGLTDVQEQRAAFDSKYAAFYYPWIYVDDPLSPSGEFKKVPPSGHMAGVYARVDGQRGVHKAPANEVVFGARGLEVNVSMAEQNLLNPMGINCIRRFPGRGIRVWGARTTSSDASWRYINVRRLFLQIEESIEQGTQWTVFEPNDPTLWAKIRRDVGAFLKRFYLQGALFGNSPEEAYFVKCDAETNPPEVIDAGQVVIEVGIAPVKPAEFVIFRVGQKPTGSSVSE